MIANKIKLPIQENITLAPLTTLKVGGAARFFVAAENEQQVIEAVKFAEENALDIFILGGGSNVLISDKGFDGMVIQIALKGIEVNKNFVTVQAGEDWDNFVKLCVEKDLQGIECLSGIPGLVGGTPVQNVGAYGQEVSETITKVCVYDRKTSDSLELTNADCKFFYRTSIFNTTEKNRFIVLSITFALNENGAPKIVYKDLQEFFRKKNPTLEETRQAVIKIRAKKSMVITEKDKNSKSAGSFFKNPIVTKEKFAEVFEKAKSYGIENVLGFAVDENNVKIPAAWLIENAGFKKGYKLGKAGLSTKHTLAIVNLGNAAAKDILDLKNLIQAGVKQKFGIELKPEPVFI